jgi:glycosyltransferase involved in cell wall biosynthesis
MRIGVNCFLLQENIGGLRQQFLRLFRELLDNDHENRYVFFYFEHNIQEMENIGNDKWKEEAILLKDQKEVIHHLDKIDLYFCPFNALWPRPVPLPSIVMLNDIQEKYYPQFFTSQDLKNRKYHYDESTRIADQVITVSQFSKESIAYHHNISKEKIHVAYLAPDKHLNENSAKVESIKSRLPDNFIFYPANRWLHKNHDNLLKALLILKKKHALTINCVFTGYDYDSGYPLDKKIVEYGLNEQVRSLGYVSKEEIAYIYKKANMLCFPSLFEGFGMPLVEAMSTGCPVVCSDAACMPEIVGDAGVFFDPSDPEDIADKIYTVWKDTDMQKMLITKGKQRAKKFSVKNLAARHLEVFNTAIQSYRRSRYWYYKYIYVPFYTVKMSVNKIIMNIKNSEKIS